MEEFKLSKWALLKHLLSRIFIIALVPLFLLKIEVISLMVATILIVFFLYTSSKIFFDKYYDLKYEKKLSKLVFNSAKKLKRNLTICIDAGIQNLKRGVGKSLATVIFAFLYSLNFIDEIQTRIDGIILKNVSINFNRLNVKLRKIMEEVKVEGNERIWEKLLEKVVKEYKGFIDLNEYLFLFVLLEKCNFVFSDIPFKFPTLEAESLDFNYKDLGIKTEYAQHRFAFSEYSIVCIDDFLLKRINTYRHEFNKEDDGSVELLRIQRQIGKERFMIIVNVQNFQQMPDTLRKLFDVVYSTPKRTWIIYRTDKYIRLMLKKKLYQIMLAVGLFIFTFSCRSKKRWNVVRGKKKKKETRADIVYQMNDSFVFFKNRIRKIEEGLEKIKKKSLVNIKLEQSVVDPDGNPQKVSGYTNICLVSKMIEYDTHFHGKIEEVLGACSTRSVDTAIKTSEAFDLADYLQQVIGKKFNNVRVVHAEEVKEAEEDKIKDVEDIKEVKI